MTFVFQLKFKFTDRCFADEQNRFTTWAH